MSKNAIWITIAVIAGIFGAMVGPSLATAYGGLFTLVMLLLFVGVIGYVIYSLSGNKKADLASPEEVSDALSMTPAAGKVRIYVIRAGFVAKLQGMEVKIGDHVCQMKGGQFAYAELDPGTYHVSGELVRSGKNSGTSSDVTLAAGEAAAIKASIEMGALAGKVKFDRAKGEEAKKLIEGAKMIRWDSAAT